MSPASPAAARCALVREAAARPLAVFQVRDEARFRDVSRRHGAGAVDGFFCEDGGECVLGPGLARRIVARTIVPGAAREGEAGAVAGTSPGIQASIAGEPAPGALARQARASDLHVLYHEGFHQYFARLGARDIDPWLAEGLAEHFARRAAAEPGQALAAERVRAGRDDLRWGAREVLGRPEVLVAGDLARVEIADLGVSVGSYRIYALFIAFLAEAEDGRLRPRLARAIETALAGGRSEVDLRGLFASPEARREAFLRFARATADGI